MSISLKLIPFAIAAFKPIKEEKTVSMLNNNIIEYNTSMTDLEVLQTALLEIGASYMVTGMKVKFSYCRFIGEAIKENTGEISIKFGSLSKSHARDIINKIYREYIGEVQNNVYNRMLETIEQKEYTIESEVIDEETQTISMTISI